MNKIKTWAQGYFVDNPRYRKWSEDEKIRANNEEQLKVRPSPTGNAICYCNNPDDAKWIAERLNLAAKLEEKIANMHQYKYPVYAVCDSTGKPKVTFLEDELKIDFQDCYELIKGSHWLECNLHIEVKGK